MRPRRQAAARSVRRRVSLSSALCVLVVSCGNGGGAAEDSLEAEVPATDDVVTTQVLLESTAAPASEVTTVPTVRVDSVPSTVSATSEVPVVSSSTSPSPLEAGDFDVELPAVEGYSYTPVPERPVPWEQLDLPGFLSGYAFGVRQSGVSIGTIVVLDQFGLTGYIKQLFDETVRLAGANGAEGSVRAGWRALGGAPVLALTLPSGMVGQWVWGHDGRTWVAVGDLAMEGYVAGLIGRQQEVAPMDPHDYELLAGGLYRRLFEIPGFLYVDLPVAEAVAALPNTLFGDCAQRLYLGHVVPVHDPDPLIMDPDDLALMAASIAGACEDGGFFNDLDTALQALPNMRKEASDARLLYRNESNVVVVEGDDVFHLTSSDPAKLVEMEPFITQFISGVKPTSPTGTSIPPGAREMFDLAEIDRVGMCVYRAPGIPGQDDLARRFFEVDCSQPHQTEMYYRFTYAAPPDAAYPGEAAIQARADPVCKLTFAAYVGVPYESSRLRFVYLFPTAETWDSGDRSVVCFLVGTEVDEMFTRSMAGAQE